MKKILITGGAGFVGQHLIKALLKRGHKLIVLDTNPLPIVDKNLTFYKVDLREENEVLNLISGVDTVVHNASIVHTKRNRESLIWDINLGGTRNVLKACQESGVKKLVYISSASVVYNGVDLPDGDESLPYSTISQAPYADSKKEAEREVLEANGVKGVTTCALRPHVIFGPGDGRLLPGIMNRANSGKLKNKVGFQKKLSDFTYVDNFVDSILLSIDAPEDKVGGEAFFITNGEPMEFFDFIGRILDRMGYKPLKGTVPYWLAYAVAALVEFYDTLRGGKLNSENGFSRFTVKYLCTDHYFSIKKAREILGYDPKVSIDEGLDLTIAEYKKQLAK